MRRFFLFILALFLLPFYPLLLGTKKVADKMHFGEQVVVVLENDWGKRILIT